MTPFDSSSDLAAAKKRYAKLIRDWEKDHPGMNCPARIREVFAQVTLEAVADSYGVEGLNPANRDGSPVLYANRGDAYAPTILAFIGFARTRFKAGNWGDLAESGRYR